ncbi:lysosomal Pro-X carboxypeptidase [Leguminivora glycinivorella]|uniref:lysosomal Pro-X carboxypeptidase n=1 Tax=Leguminivora glycinivorella TaxID=1035111 RepID=UPI00200EE7A3|nr:lysosomal Pro-X carboxypeptidase [Leguminivora glycinivorella]
MWRITIPLLFTLTIVKSEYKYTTNWFTVPLDHFGYQRTEVFKIKYLVNEEHWDRDGGPIFFYTGNEGQIEVFAKHTGFMWDIAEEFKAKLVFAEHRYYGDSKPFGDKSLDNEHIGYLTSAQALADYADLLDYLQDHQVVPKYPVIAFGGSYGGMLSAYIRMKYPHMVTGSIAASAPIHMFPGMVPCEAFPRIVTSSFNLAGETCVQNIKASWATLRNFSTTANSSEWLQKNWKLCDPVRNATEVQQLIDFIGNMYGTLAMVNYPFASDFLMPLPANPVRVVCQYLNETLKGQALLEGIGKMLQVYANYNGSSKCVDYKKGEDLGNLDASGWNYQACTEMVMPMCTTGVHDMFEPVPWNFTSYSKECYDKFKVYPKEQSGKTAYGGDRIQAASNIVFSNGLMDPWAGGGILNSISDTVQAVIIFNGAHHLDLMPANPADPDTVKMTRNTHKEHIRKWIAEFRAPAK